MTHSLLDPTDPPAFVAQRLDSAARAVVLCDHASNAVPKRLASLGLSHETLQTHIAWDPGAAIVAKQLAQRLQAPLVMSGYSRLVIDCNRPLDVPSSIPDVSAKIPITANQSLSTAQREERANACFWPYHRTIEQLLRDREARNLQSAILSVHSFTPEPLFGPRPWHAGMVYGGDRRLAGLFLQALSKDNSLVLGDNQPYQVTDKADYDIPRYAEDAGRPGVLIEIRQDLLREEQHAIAWGNRLADAFLEIESTLWTLFRA